jgi:CRP-like cAMP-binding protein
VSPSYVPSFAPRNRLLQKLPADSLARLRPHLSQVELPLRQTLHLHEVPITQIYFIETGWVSMIAPLEDGDGAEVGLVGSEGFVGLPILLGSDSDDVEAMVQCPGTAFSLSIEAFRTALESDPILQAWLLRYALVHQSQVARTAACNGRHQIEQRLARWLLMAHDRAEGDDYPMTHEFLAMMLGVRRAGVMMAAGLLQKAQLISYERGRMTIIDRPGLENVSCECYGMVRRASDRLFAHPGQPQTPYRR